MDYSYEEATDLGTKAAIVTGGREFFSAPVQIHIANPPLEGWPHVYAIVRALHRVRLTVMTVRNMLIEPEELSIYHMGDVLRGDRVGCFIDYAEGFRKEYDEALSWFIMDGLDRIEQSLDRVEVDDA